MVQMVHMTYRLEFALIPNISIQDEAQLGWCPGLFVYKSLVTAMLMQKAVIEVWLILGASGEINPVARLS
jgi:hypothetical protein